MRARRGAHIPDRDLCRGPGRLCQAFRLTREHDGLDLRAGPLRMLPPPRGATRSELIIGLAESELNSSAPFPRWLRVLGKPSYAIYLGHLLAIGVVRKVLERLDLATSLPPSELHKLLIAAGLAGGIVLSMVVEYPLMRLARRLWARAFAPAVGGAAR